MATVPSAGPRRSTVIIVAELVALVLAAAFALYQLRPTATAPTATASGDSAAAAPAAPAPWTGEQLRQLAAAVQAAGAEGLRPSDYQLDALQRAADAGQSGAAVDKIADDAARALAHDYAAGRIRNRHRFNWYIDYTGPDAAALGKQVTAARERGDLTGWLTGLLPTSPQYRALRDALAATPDSDGLRRDRIKANLERWRWLPRDFGRGDQLYVNLPTYQLELIEGGQTVASYRAVIGATDMPTPVLSSTVRQVIANPDWIVPQSIVRKSHLRPGGKYEFSTRPDGSLRVRQKPGAGNALGRVKIEFPNKLAIYFHDTPSRSLFGADMRAFSHGCVRVQHIEELAASIVADRDRFATALAGDKTRSLRPGRPLQANIVYLTLVPGADGGLADVGDPYKMDAAMAAALDPGGHRAPSGTSEVVAASPATLPVPVRPPAPTPRRVVRPALDTVASTPVIPAEPQVSVDAPVELPATANAN